jgi:hypothetical protein
MRRAVLISTQEWIQNKGGRVLRIPFNCPPHSILIQIEESIQKQISFVCKLTSESEKSYASEVAVNVPTHDPELKISSRDDCGEMKIKIDRLGKITELSITEKFSYTQFQNQPEEIPIFLLAKYFPDELLDSFEFKSNSYGTSNVPDCKIPLTYRLHDYGEEQLWVKLEDNKDHPASNADYMSVIDLWLKLLEKYPRKPKARSK